MCPPLKTPLAANLIYKSGLSSFNSGCALFIITSHSPNPFCGNFTQPQDFIQLPSLSIHPSTQQIFIGCLLYLVEETQWEDRKTKTLRQRRGSCPHRMYGLTKKAEDTNKQHATCLSRGMNKFCQSLKE